MVKNSLDYKTDIQGHISNLLPRIHFLHDLLITNSELVHGIIPGDKKYLKLHGKLINYIIKRIPSFLNILFAIRETNFIIMDGNDRKRVEYCQLLHHNFIKQIRFE